MSTMGEEPPLRGLPSPPDDLERRRAFEADHPDITISPPETHASPWTARREGKILASGHQLGQLLNSLERLFRAQPAQPARVISVMNPWAWRIVAGLQAVEERAWKTSWRGRLWIHASKDSDPSAPVAMWPSGRTLATSAIIGNVTLADVEGEPGAWRWVLTGPVELAEPLTGVRGQPGIWLIDLPPEFH